MVLVLWQDHSALRVGFSPLRRLELLFLMVLLRGTASLEEATLKE